MFHIGTIDYLILLLSALCFFPPEYLRQRRPGRIPLRPRHLLYTDWPKKFEREMGGVLTRAVFVMKIKGQISQFSNQGFFQNPLHQK